MSHFKAPEATLTVGQSNVSMEQNKSFMGQESGVFGADNPSPHQQGINRLNALMVAMRMYSRKYDLNPEALELLIRIGKNWNVGQSTTVYSLCLRADKGDKTSLHAKVSRLYAKGLISVVGTGKWHCKAYAPSALGKQLLDDLCKV